MTEIEAEKLATESQYLVNRLYKSPFINKVYIVTDVTKNLKTDSTDDWDVLVACLIKDPEHPNITSVNEINFFIANYSHIV